jgi:uncharacterized protein (DUF58 family)
VNELSSELPTRLRRWIFRNYVEPVGDITLDRRRVFILPTRAGALFGMVAVAIWFTSLNFNLQLGFFLAFLAMSVGLVAMYETHRNLVHLAVRELRCSAVHAGEVAGFDFVIDNPHTKARYAIHLAFILPRRRRLGSTRETATQGVWVDVPASSAVRVTIGLPTRRRGRRDCPRVRISTRFPFGLWQAWAYASPQMSTIVYPSAEPSAPPLPQGADGDPVGTNGTTVGTDDFAGVRPYRLGDPLRSVAWRLAARGDELCVKVFESSAGEETVFNFATLPGALSVEERLSRLTRWVLIADAAGLRYGLVLPQTRLATASGPEQRTRCLEALALYPAAEPAHP